MLVRLSDSYSAITEADFLIFMNKNRSYPIRGTPDYIPGVSYRTGPKGWVYTNNMLEWLKEERALKSLPDGNV